MASNEIVKSGFDKRSPVTHRTDDLIVDKGYRMQKIGRRRFAELDLLAVFKNTRPPNNCGDGHSGRVFFKLGCRHRFCFWRAARYSTPP